MNQERLLEAKSLIESHPDESVRICNEILNEDPESRDGQFALYLISYVMLEAERHGLAYHLFKRCLELDPKNAVITSSLGMTLDRTDKQKALQYFLRAIDLDPSQPDFYANAAHMYLDLGQPGKCIEFCDKSLSINPNQVSAHHNKAMANLMLRNWPEGWEGYASTLGCKERRAMDYGLPDWDFESAGKILVYGEQGVGDEIMFASCLSDFVSDVGVVEGVVFDTDSRLQSLFARSFEFPVYGTRFKDESPILKEHDLDYQVAIGQLPYLYRSHGDFPGKPYLKPDQERCVMWRALFDMMPGKKIGVAWTGGIQKNSRTERCVDLEAFSELFNDQDTFICLEYDPVLISDLEKYNLKHYPKTVGKGQDIDDLAALINELDYVICVCTTVLHIAGALGKECHVLTPSCPPANMLLEGDLPWYDSVKMHRQKKGESWRKLIKRVMECLEYS